MRVLVTGAGGFIGRAVIQKLTEEEIDALAFFGPDDPEIAVAGAAFRGDVRDSGLVSCAVEEASMLVHLAGPASVAASFANPALYASVHATGTAVVFDAARRRGMARAVLVSSAEIYGQPEVQPTAEVVCPAPRSPYGAAKLAAEALARTLLPDRLTIIRPFSVYGSGMRRDSVLGRILDQALAGESVELENLLPVRDYLHVDDLAALICLCVEMEIAPPRVMNACSGLGVSVGDLGRLVGEIVGQGSSVTQASGSRGRPTDILELIGDPRVALALGWAGARSLRQGLTDLVKSWGPAVA